MALLLFQHDAEDKFIEACANNDLKKVMSAPFELLSYEVINIGFNNACRYNRLSLAQWLYKNAKVDLHYDGDSPLEEALNHRHFGFADWLISLGKYSDETIYRLSGSRDLSYLVNLHRNNGSMALRFANIWIYKTDDKEIIKWIYSIAKPSRTSERVIQYSLDHSDGSLLEWAEGAGILDTVGFEVANLPFNDWILPIFLPKYLTKLHPVIVEQYFERISDYDQLKAYYSAFPSISDNCIMHTIVRLKDIEPVKWLFALRRDAIIEGFQYFDIRNVALQGELKKVQFFYTIPEFKKIIDEKENFFTDCCKSENLALVEWANTTVPLKNYNKAFKASCCDGNYEIAQWLNSNAKITKYLSSAFKVCCGYYPHIARWLYTLDSNLTPKQIHGGLKRACRGGHEDIILWLLSLGKMSITNKHFQKAIDGKQLKVAKLLYSIGKIDVRANDDYVFKSSIRNADHRTFEWLTTICNAYAVITPDHKHKILK